MILAYPDHWHDSIPPVYLVCDDVAFYILDAVTWHNFQRTGIPVVAMTQADMLTIVEKLDPRVEHPLSDVVPVRDPEDPFDPLIGS
jgi:hypothetical protein